MQRQNNFWLHLRTSPWEEYGSSACICFCQDEGSLIDPFIVGGCRFEGIERFRAVVTVEPSILETKCAGQLRANWPVCCDVYDGCPCV